MDIYECDARARHCANDLLTRTLIGDALGLPAEAITPTHRWAFGMGWLDEGCCCVNFTFDTGQEVHGCQR